MRIQINGPYYFKDHDHASFQPEKQHKKRASRAPVHTVNYFDTCRAQKNLYARGLSKTSYHSLWGVSRCHFTKIPDIFNKSLNLFYMQL